MTNEKIRVVFIETSNGETLLFYGTLDADYSIFRDIFLELASGRVTEICLNDISVFHIQKNLIIKMIAQDKSKTPTVTVNDDPNNPVIHWIMNREDWEYSYDYLEGFDTENRPCHQYLFNDYEIVPTISKGEYDDAMFEEYFD